MINKLKPKSEFNRNILTLMTGTTISQAIPIAISPILTRIYTPEDFGIVGLYAAIAGIFGVIATGRYELAIMLPKKDEDAINIFALGFLITLGLTLFLLIMVSLFSQNIALLLKNESMAFWLYFIPLTVFFTGLFNLLNYLNNRKKQYKDIANAIIVKSIVTVMVQLVVGFVKGGVVGLISGNLIAAFFANAKLLMSLIKEKKLLFSISKIKILALAKRYKDFPKFSLWAALANISSQNFSNILISLFYGVTTLGFYGLVQRVLGIPMTLVGNSISQVFYQQATKEKQKTGTAIKTFNSTLKKLILIAVPTFSILFFVVEDLFTFVFGEEWRVAGIYAHILVPLFLIKFIVSPLTTVNQIYLKNKLGLLWQSGLLIINLSIFIIGKLIKLSFINILSLLTVVISLYFIYYLYLIYNLCKE